MDIKTIGIVLEQASDAKALNLPMEHLYHWRVPREIEAIRGSIEALGYEVVVIGTPKVFMNRWHQLKDSIDFIFNLSVGFVHRFRLAEGPMLYETAGIPYSGADPYTKMVTQNKHVFKAMMDKMQIDVPEWVYVPVGKMPTEDSLPQGELFIKPAYEGSSIGIDSGSVVGTYDEVKSVVQRLHKSLNMPVIVEKFIVGREFKVGILGNGNTKSCYMLEDVKSDGRSLGNEFLGFKSKTEGSYSKVYRDIHRPEYRAMKEMCLEVYDQFEPVDYGTFDIRMDNQGRPYIIEFNADATLHPDRTLAKCCEFGGVSYGEMIQKILEAALKRGETD